MSDNERLWLSSDQVAVAVEPMDDVLLYWTKAIPYVGPDGGPFRPLTEYLQEMEDRIVQRVTRAITGHDDS